MAKTVHEHVGDLLRRGMTDGDGWTITAADDGAAPRWRGRWWDVYVGGRHRCCVRSSATRVVLQAIASARHRTLGETLSTEPVRECPRCYADTPARARTCDVCGWVDPAHNPEAYDHEVGP